jgi:hypothetical protein
MSSITNLWGQLVQRRLWPVAILLVAALAAVPLALAKQPAPANPAAPLASTDKGDDVLASQPIVAQASAADRSKHHKVLGKAKNPFGVAETETGSGTPPSSDGVAKADDSAATTTSTTSGGTTPTTSGDSTTPTTTPPTGTTTPVPAPPKTYDMYDLTVRFGDENGTARKTLKRLQPLPSKESPVLIYLGVMRDGKTAVFLVGSNVNPVGDGSCDPGPDDCQTLRLRAGDTEFLDVVGDGGTVGAQYQLDLVKIHKGKTTSAKRASASYAGSKAGRRLLRARVAADGPTGFKWDASLGALTRAHRSALHGSVASVAVALP